uniref:Isochorismatase domain-containing protein 1 n=1 Tax=Xenopsylla cheopis TaxID=163159 RepID=A0A6M2DIM0_XENCH
MAKVAQRSFRGFLEPSKTVFILCDVQEKFRPVMKHFDQAIQTSNKLVKSAQALKIPLLCTEQNPAALGHTVSDIDTSHAAAIISKTTFSMLTPELKNKIDELGGSKIDSIVIFGLETHICVEQSVMDFTEQGYQVHVVADATISRSQEDRMLALERMRNMGAIITTSENVIFKLVKDASKPEFKSILGLVKVPSPETGLVSKI